MGQAESNESAAVKRQAEGASNPMYELLDLGGKLFCTLEQKPTFYPEITKNLMFEIVNFVKKWDFENVNFVKKETLKMRILSKNQKNEISKLWIFEDFCPSVPSVYYLGI